MSSRTGGSKRNTLVALLVAVLLVGAGAGFVATDDRLRSDPADPTAPDGTAASAAGDGGTGSDADADGAESAASGESGTAGDAESDGDDRSNRDAGGGATLDLGVTAPADVRDAVGDVERVEGGVGGRLAWSDAGVDRVVLVVESRVPGHGWTEIRRAYARPEGTGELDLATALGDGGRLAFARGERAAAYRNRADDTRAVREGRIGVTALLFDGDREVDRVERAAGYEFGVVNEPQGRSGRGGGGRGGADASDEPTVSLTVADGRAVGPLVAVSGVAPGGSGANAVAVRNGGERDGVLGFRATELRNLENGRTEAERAVDSTGGALTGELGEVLELRVRLERADGSTAYVVGGPGAFVPVDRLSTDDVAGSARVDAGERVRFVTEWRLPASAGNELQTDSVELTVELSLRDR